MTKPLRELLVAGALLILPAGWTLASASCAFAGPDSPGSHIESSDGTWSQFQPPVPIEPMQSEASVYDGARSRVLVFGGQAFGLVMNHLWSLSLAGVARWEELSPAGAPPSVRYGHSMVYDSARDRLLVFGGTSDGTHGFSDLWELSLSGTPTWHLITANNPPPGRFGHVAIYDPGGDRMIVFGGYRGIFLNDTWQLSLSGTPTWSQLPTPGVAPAPRDYATAIYDPIGQRVLLSGGNASFSGTPAQPVADTWTLSLVGEPVWTPLATIGLPPTPRLLASSLYDPQRRRMLITGGTAGYSWDTDIIALTLDGTPTWSAVQPTGSGPVPYSGSQAIFDAAADRVVAFAGLTDGARSEDAWTFSMSGGTGWVPYATQVPFPRLNHQAIYDPARHRLVQFGGTASTQSGLVPVNDSWAFALDGSGIWSPLAASSPSQPAARTSHVLVPDLANDRLILFGGNNATTIFNDLWTFDLGTEAWSPLAPIGAPPSPREAMAGVYDAARSRLLIFGGWLGNYATNETWELDLLPTPTWRIISPAGSAPAPRFAHSMILDSPRDRLLVFGGFDQFVRYGDVWALNLSGAPVWTRLAPVGAAPGKIYGHSAIYDPLRDRMITFGGYGTTFLNTVFALNLSGNPSWSQLAPAGAPPSPRDFAGVVYDAANDRLILTEGNGTPAGDAWALSWDGLATPTLLSLVDTETAPGRVTLRWQASDATSITATVERSTDGATWTPLGNPRLEGTDLLVYDDLGVVPGHYEYRLGYTAGGAEQWSEPVAVDVPGAAQLALGGFRPNPAIGNSAISFILPDAKPARLEVLDVRGRIMLSREVGALGPGSHSLPLSEVGRLGAGVYWVRLVRPEGTLVRKGVVAG